MDIKSRQQSPADRLAGPAFEEHIIRHDHCRAAVDLQQGGDVLDKVELLVAGGGPEIVALVGQGIPLGFAFAVDNGHAALLAKGRIGQHHIEALTRIGDKRIVDFNRRVLPTDAVQVQVHHA